MEKSDEYIRLADEPFLTIQGEGPSAGKPAYFIRLQGCTVGCEWCDTKYSWAVDKGNDYPLERLKKDVNALPSSVIVVITGGEPVEHAETIHTIVNSFDRSRWVEIETSGYIYRPDLGYQLSQLIISPKVLPSARVAFGKQMTSSVAIKWLMSSAPVFWKFVLRDQADLDAFDSFADSLGFWGDSRGFPPRKVWFMPEGMRPEEVLERGRWLAEVCKERGYNLSLRQHVLLWGAKRGV
jgi:7-carboxy-7-deazaguanine synthase